MFLVLNDVLSSAAVDQLRSDLQVEDKYELTRNAAAIVTRNLLSNPLFLLAVQPKSLSEPVFRRFDEGMESGSVVEDAMVEGNGGIRADVRVSLFLSDPASYEGGELVVDSGYGGERIKEGAGSCVVYPASVRHSVARVLRGTRWTAEICAQSLVRDPRQREILYDIGYSLHLVELFGAGREQDVKQLQEVQRNLLRLWAES